MAAGRYWPGPALSCLQITRSSRNDVRSSLSRHHSALSPP
jgi:hypothetical protein